MLYICCEDSETKIKEREIAQGWNRGLPVYWLDRFKLSELSHLRAIAEELEPRLIVFDTLSRIRDDGISESSAEMSRCLEPLQEMAEELNCCILLVHHTGKVKLDNADKIDVFETIRGSSAIRAVCRGSWVLAADDNRCFRLCVEHGYGKEDLRLALDASTLRWQSLGTWQPAMVNPTQAERVLEYLNREREGTIDEIHIATGLPKRSLYVVLSRLHADEVVSKSGSRRRIVYKRLENLQSLQKQNCEVADSSSENLANTLLEDSSPGEERFVRSTGKNGSIPLSEKDSLSQQVSNKQSTLVAVLDEICLAKERVSSIRAPRSGEKPPSYEPFQRGDPVEFFDGNQWIASSYHNRTDRMYFSPITRQLEDCHFIRVADGPNSGLLRKVARSAMRLARQTTGEGGCSCGK